MKHFSHHSRLNHFVVVLQYNLYFNSASGTDHPLSFQLENVKEDCDVRLARQKYEFVGRILGLHVTVVIAK